MLEVIHKAIRRCPEIHHYVTKDSPVTLEIMLACYAVHKTLKEEIIDTVSKQHGEDHRAKARRHLDDSLAMLDTILVLLNEPSRQAQQALSKLLDK